jgi:hypothetical protein
VTDQIAIGRWNRRGLASRHAATASGKEADIWITYRGVVHPVLLADGEALRKHKDDVVWSPPGGPPTR